MIDEEATFKKYGYYSWEWGRCSIKRIIAACDECGKVRDVRKTNYCTLCSGCARRGERNPMFGKSPSEATKQKMRENCVCLSGPQHPMYGKPISDEHKRILTKANKGKYPSKETRAKRSETLKGRIITEEARRKISETLMGKMCGNKNPNWRGGSSFDPYCAKFNEEFKEYIRVKFDRKCFLCENPEEENGRRLSVHHVNYDKNCGCAETE